MSGDRPINTGYRSVEECNDRLGADDVYIQTVLFLAEWLMSATKYMYPETQSPTDRSFRVVRQSNISRYHGTVS